MSAAQAVLLGVCLAAAYIPLVIAGMQCVRWWRNRRMERQWKAAMSAWDGKLEFIPIPSPCTCCPVHGHSSTQSDESAGEVSAEPGRDPSIPESGNGL